MYVLQTKIKFTRQLSVLILNTKFNQDCL